MIMFFLNVAIAITNIAMGLLEETHTTPTASTASKSPTSSRRSSSATVDSGYTSNIDARLEDGKKTLDVTVSPTNGPFVGHYDILANKIAAQIQPTHDEKDEHVTIQHNYLLYSIIAFLLLYIFDKRLLVLPLMVGTIAYFAMAIFGAHANAERVLGLCAFRIDWSPKIEV
jgi:hypothetical protein